MIRNPFARKPTNPIDQAVDAFDGVRRDAADYAATIRDVAADVADTLAEIGPAARRGRKLPIIVAAVVAGLGLAYVLRSKLGGDAAQEPFPPPIAQPAAATAARTTAGSEPSNHEPLAATDSEEPREPKATTPESHAAKE
jgi:hypothetical protein